MDLKIILPLCLVLVLFNPSNAQTKTLDTIAARKSLMAAADTMASLFLSSDLKNYVHYVHPRIVKLMGGENRMISHLDSSMGSIRGQGIELRNVSIASGSKLFLEKKELQAYVTEILELKVPNGRLVATSYLIALSGDGGKKWYFIDTANNTIEQIRNLFPSLSKQLVLPEKKKPVFYPE